MKTNEVGSIEPPVDGGLPGSSDSALKTTPVPVIELHGVERTYDMGGGNVVRALRGVDLTIHSGEFVAIVGPSGSGKSTLMYMLGCLDQPSAGSYRLCGEEVGGLDDAALSRIRNQRIGYVFQSYNLLTELDVVDNISLGLVYAGAAPEKRRKRGSELAGRMGLGERLDHTPRELSGGQMQRVAIARGLACDPQIILADEPTGNLDQHTGAEIMILLRELHAQGRTIVLVTHDDKVAKQAERVVRIVDGVIVSDEASRKSEVGSEEAEKSGMPMSAVGSVPPTSGLPDFRTSGSVHGTMSPSDLLHSALREGLLAHKLRSFLTMLGIVFGVAAVIAMTAITEGGKQQQLEQIRQIGLNNIQVKGLDLEGARLLRVRRVNPEGLTLTDLAELRRHVPGIAADTAWKSIKAELRAGEKSFERAQVLGVQGDFQNVSNFHVARGRFLDDLDQEQASRVCVLGSEVADGLGLAEQAVGSTVIVGDEPFTVVGVMGRKAFSSSDIADASVADRNRDVYLPFSALRAYFRKALRDSPLDVISLRMDGDEQLLERSKAIKRIIGELHEGAEDFTVAVPLESLKQAQRTREVFNVIIAVIAAISLLVGGIGIMNIMLAAVTERTREIGIRRAIGASQRDILAQFLAEALLISTFGACIGLLLGVGSALLVQALFGFPVAFSLPIIGLAVGTALSVGIAFGIYPAWKAALMNPVDALRN